MTSTGRLNTIPTVGRNMERRGFIKSTVASAVAPTALGGFDTLDRDKESAPDFSDMLEDIDTDRLTMCLYGEGWRAVASPAVNYKDTENAARGRGPFPFKWDGDAPDEERLGEMFAERFDNVVSAVYEYVREQGDPLQATMDLDLPDGAGLGGYPLPVEKGPIRRSSQGSERQS